MHTKVSKDLGGMQLGFWNTKLDVSKQYMISLVEPLEGVKSRPVNLDLFFAVHTGS